MLHPRSRRQNTSDCATKFMDHRETWSPSSYRRPSFTTTDNLLLHHYSWGLLRQQCSPSPPAPTLESEDEDALKGLSGSFITLKVSYRSLFLLHHYPPSPLLHRDHHLHQHIHLYNPIPHYTTCGLTQHHTHHVHHSAFFHSITTSLSQSLLHPTQPTKSTINHHQKHSLTFFKVANEQSQPPSSLPMKKKNHPTLSDFDLERKREGFSSI
ncbi:unnamed protein product [Lactuca saligna]|uniref:Uncharacterized protein n=1 Tax=Lactuca saligna TaxID=75948 RepID=A0AA36DYH9_LACSI|nr:unnamed protein product [Lactuca saligna]